ncbi:hypothetical protein EGW08_015932 [Elysia chlorotica]|uniref:LRRCT domain-containing protein n=1 Tax=Elysia chlorotica TaxID=188477 RepID=A0A3S1BW23_ELYCH|nr:hypothetical protein EGW08_015932 [Elysia chlorotica]
MFSSGLQFLQTIRLSNNQLGALMADSFVGLGSLATLTLASNPLTFIEQGAFRNLANLTTLDLSYVEGGHVELQYDFLQEMLRLETLNLFGSTHLAQRVLDKVRDAGHVTPLSELQTMDVRYANLQTVPSRVRQLFPNMRSFLLDGNPLRCTESLRWLRQWMDEAGSTVQFHEHAEPTCNSPLRLRGRALASLAHAEWGADDEVDALRPAAGGDGSYGYNGGMVNDQPQEHQQGMPVDGQYFMRPMPVEEAKAPKSGPQIQNEAETQELGSKMAASQEGKMAAKQDGKMAASKEGKMADKSKSMPRPMNMVLAPAGGLENTKGRDGKDMEVTPAGKVKKYRRDRKNGKKMGRKGRKINRRQGRRGKKGRKLGRGKTRNRKDRQNMKNRKNRERKRRRRVTVHTGKQA